MNVHNFPALQVFICVCAFCSAIRVLRQQRGAEYGKINLSLDTELPAYVVMAVVGKVTGPHPTPPDPNACFVPVHKGMGGSQSAAMRFIDNALFPDRINRPGFASVQW